MPRAGLTADRVVAAAEVLADDVGLPNLTLAALADRLGVRQPSLYKHIDGAEALRRAISLRAMSELAESLARSAAGRARGDAVRAIAIAYRTWAQEHPGRYTAMLRAPDPGDPEGLAASDRLVSVVVDVLSGYGLAEEDAIHAIRALRSAMHGFVAIEAAGGFGLPVDLDESFDFLVANYVRGLESR